MKQELSGQRLGEYRVIRPIGSGGTARIYLAKNRYNEPCALKVLLPHLQSQPEFVARFLRKAKRFARLNHQNIITIHDFQQMPDGTTFFAMEWVQRGSLADLMAQRRQQNYPFNAPELLHIIGQVGAALDYAHKHGVIHQDVKPSNILLTQQGQVKLTDFGIAKIAQTTTITRPGEQVGTPAYMSPEQACGGDITPRTDIYALGIVCYEMLAGRPPFHGDTSQVLAILYQHVHAPPPPLRQYNRHLPPTIDRVIGKVLAKKPEERYCTASEFVTAVKSALEQQTFSSTLRKRIPVILGTIGGLGLLLIGLILMWLLLELTLTSSATVAEIAVNPIPSTQSSTIAITSKNASLSPTSTEVIVVSPISDTTVEVSPTFLLTETPTRPTLLQPPDGGESIFGEKILLQWQWRSLNQNEQYLVTVNQGGQTILQEVTTDSELELSTSLELGVYNWLIIVRQQAEYKEVARSKQQRFQIVPPKLPKNPSELDGFQFDPPALQTPPNGYGTPSYNDVTLTWESQAILSAEQCYVVIISHRQGIDYQWLGTTSYTLGEEKRWLAAPDFGPNLTWQVVIAQNEADRDCQFNEGTPTHELSPRSESYALRWVN